MKRSVVEAILSSPLSVHTNAFTSTRVYSFFPNMITSKYSIASNIFDMQSAEAKSTSYQICASNGRWVKPCGPLCPAMERKSMDDAGTASFFWNPSCKIPTSRHPTTDSLLAESIISWRFSLRCGNLNCVNYSPADAWKHRFF